MSRPVCVKCQEPIVYDCDVMCRCCAEKAKQGWQKITPDNLPPEGVPVFVKEQSIGVIELAEMDEGKWMHIARPIYRSGEWDYSCGLQMSYTPTHYHRFPELEGLNES